MHDLDKGGGEDTSASEWAQISDHKWVDAGRTCGYVFFRGREPHRRHTKLLGFTVVVIFCVAIARARSHYAKRGCRKILASRWCRR